MAAASAARRRERERAAAKQNRKTRAPSSNTDGEKKKTLGIDAILKKPNRLSFGLSSSFGTTSNNEEEFQSSFLSQGSGSKGSKKKKASSDVRSSSTKRDGVRPSSTKRDGVRPSSANRGGVRPSSAKSTVPPPTMKNIARPTSRVVQDFTMSFAPTPSFANLLKNMSDGEDESSDEDSLEDGAMLNRSYKSQKSSDSALSRDADRNMGKSAPELSNRNYTSQKSGGSGTSGEGAKNMTDAEREEAAVAKIQSVFAGIGKVGGDDGDHKKLKNLTSSLIMGRRLSKLASEASECALAVEIEPNPSDDDDLVVPDVVLELWKIVAEGAEDGSADNKEIHTALETAKKYYTTTKEGKEFVDQNLYVIIKLLLSQSPRNLSLERDQLGETEYAKVEKSIRFALQLINDDLRTKGHKFTAKCETLDALHKILDHKNIYFHKSTPSVRMDKILVFQRIKGFYHLAIYLNARANTKAFPEWELVHRGLKTAYEGLASSQVTGSDDENFQDKFRKEAKNMCEGVMQHLKSMKLDVIEKQEIFKLNIIMNDMKLLFSEIAISFPAAILDYFAFQKVLILKLLSTKSEEHFQYGEDILHILIESTHATRPVVKAYQVEDSGHDFVDGAYNISSSKLDKEGYLIPGLEVSYEHVNDSDKKMMLFYDKSFADGDPAWCLSEEHEDEPGQHEYTDYFVAYGSRKDPPVEEWEPVDDSDTFPTVKGLPGMIPIREEHKSIKEDLAKWLIEKKIPDLVLGTNICGPCDTSTTSKVAEALDTYAEGDNVLSAKTANLFVSLFPSLQSSSTTPGRRSISISPKQDAPASKAAIEAAKARLASAERWKETASKSLKSAQTALMSAKTEHQAAVNEAEEARKYLASVDSNYESNGASMSSVAFDEDTSTITYDDQRPSKFVNDEDSSTSSSSGEMILKEKNPRLGYY